MASNAQTHIRSDGLQPSSTRVTIVPEFTEDAKKMCFKREDAKKMRFKREDTKKMRFKTEDEKKMRFKREDAKKMCFKT
jgi:hypothetical protein